MYILSGVVLILGVPFGLVWVLSAIAWGRIRRPVAFPQDGLAAAHDALEATADDVQGVFSGIE
jgi:hypothetical protein